MSDKQQYVVLVSCAVLQVVVGGIRFVDGHLLLNFAFAGYSNPLPTDAQYLYDSPLKIFLFYMLPIKSIYAVGLLALLLNMFPLAAIWLMTGNTLERISILAVMTIMPIWKMMFQNVGIGDGFVLSCTIALLFGAPSIAAIAATLLMLWHAQQGILIVLTLSIFLLLTVRKIAHDRIKAIAIGTGLGMALFLIIKMHLGFQYVDRMDYLMGHALKILSHNILLFPVILCVAIPGMLLVLSSRLTTDAKAIAAALFFAISICIGLVTFDSSRVVLLLTFPTVLFFSNPRTGDATLIPRLLSNTTAYPWLAMGILVPLTSWSGIDASLWSTLPRIIAKY